MAGGSIRITDAKHSKLWKDVKPIFYSNKPILGICLGCQIIAQRYGGTLQALQTPHFGMRKIRCVKDSDILSVGQYLCKEMHYDIIHSLPPKSQLEVIAKSAKCEIEGIRHRNKPIYGVQFHPELSGSTGESMILRFISLCH